MGLFATNFIVADRVFLMLVSCLWRCGPSGGPLTATRTLCAVVSSVYSFRWWSWRAFCENVHVVLWSLDWWIVEGPESRKSSREYQECRVDAIKAFKVVDMVNKRGFRVYWLAYTPWNGVVVCPDRAALVIEVWRLQPWLISFIRES